MEALTLYELNNLVRSVLEETLPDSYWVQAELSEVRVGRNGHCYLEFVQKDTRSNALVAKARGTIWRSVFALLKPYFEEETGQSFVSGLKVMVQVHVSFHELYGYSLTITDIDPTYTMGDMVRRRREILQQLEDDGVLTLNKELKLPRLIQRIAVISSATAAGYGDFSHQMIDNAYGFHLQLGFFPAVMQGDKVEASLIAALDEVAKNRDHWDVVVIIRGGGAVSDLSGFDTYLLANCCAQFPLPVFTGIGHERDDTVIDMVAHSRFKTPTAVASFLVERMKNNADELSEQTVRLRNAVYSIMDHEKERFQCIAYRIPSISVQFRIREEARIDRLNSKLGYAARHLMTSHFHRLEQVEKNIYSLISQYLFREIQRLEWVERNLQLASPERWLSLGYSITTKKGKVVRKASDLKQGDEIITRFEKGEVKSIVE